MIRAGGSAVTCPRGSCIVLPSGPSARNHDADRTSVEGAFRDAAQQQVSHDARTLCPDDEQLGARAGHSAEEIAKRFAVKHEGTSSPAASPQAWQRCG